MELLSFAAEAYFPLPYKRTYTYILYMDPVQIRPRFIDINSETLIESVSDFADKLFI